MTFQDFVYNYSLNNLNHITNNPIYKYYRWDNKTIKSVNKQAIDPNIFVNLAVFTSFIFNFKYIR